MNEDDEIKDVDDLKMSPLMAELDGEGVEDGEEEGVAPASDDEDEEDDEAV